MPGRVLRDWAAGADELLRSAGRFSTAAPSHEAARLAVILILVAASLYGAVMGSFGLDSVWRLPQVLYSAVKLPLLLGATTLICLPGFFVLNTALGLRADWPISLRAILAAQAALSISLLSLAPITRFVYFTTTEYQHAHLANFGAFTIATLAGHSVMRRAYRPLAARRPLHRAALVAWIALYAFVGIQMGWMLRPFIGAPGVETAFLRDEPFTNAYVVVARLLSRGV
jgi:hypothetical protein